jgi:hypothetical protein
MLAHSLSKDRSLLAPSNLSLCPLRCQFLEDLFATKTQFVLLITTDTPGIWKEQDMLAGGKEEQQDERKKCAS